jgi:hypothetical protein
MIRRSSSTSVERAFSYRPDADMPAP